MYLALLVNQVANHCSSVCNVGTVPTLKCVEYSPVRLFQWYGITLRATHSVQTSGSYAESG